MKGKQLWLLLLYLGTLKLYIVQGFGLIKVTDPLQSLPKGGAAGNGDQSICLTKGCVLAASELINNVDETVDPCENFFDFACGNFVKLRVLPDDKAAIYGYSLLRDDLKKRLRILLENPIAESDSKLTKLNKNLYNTCRNTDLIKKNGVNPLKEMIEKQYGGMPVIMGPTWNERQFSWVDTLLKNRENGISHNFFFSFFVYADLKNSSWRIMYLDQPSFGIKREYLVQGLNDKVVHAYCQFATKAAILLGAKKSDAKEQMLEVLKFEIKLANISLPREKRRNYTELYNAFTIEEIERKFPISPNWMDFLSSILPKNVSKLSSSDKIVVNDIMYMQKFKSIIDSTNKRTLANYMMLRIIRETATYLSEDIRELEFIITKAQTGKLEREPRWKECTDIVQTRLDYAISNLYVKNYFDLNAKKQMLEMVSELRTEFDRSLKVIDWMDKETRIAALKKSEAIKAQIAFPDELLNDQIVLDHYARLNLTDGLLFDAMRNLSAFSSDDSLGKLREKVNKTDWKQQGAVAVVNAYYSALENAIKFPAGILQGLFFQTTRPHYLNYGSIGTVIGHEITHGFDDQGKQFSADGDLQNWWNPETEEKFQQKKQCMIWQYGNYTAPENGLKLNGITTQGENIADNGGYSQSYKAYQSWVAKKGVKEELLPGLNYTQNQLFWVSAAQAYCYKARPESLRESILTATHTPARFRVIGSISNQIEFANDFKCSATAAMNPPTKCVIW